VNEKKLQFRVLFKLLICVAFAFLYSWGGIEMKYLRRFVAPALLVGSMLYFSRDWKVLIQLPLMFFSLSLGYGSDIFIWKIIKRGIFGLANGITSSGQNILKKKWLLAGVQTVLLTGLYIVIGVYNPFPSARAEEMFLGLMIAVIPLFSTE
jgi:hypothetical protein